MSSRKLLIFLLKMRVGEIQKVVPVRRQHVMLARVAVETDVVLDGVIKWRKIHFGNSRFAEQFINRRGGAGGEKFAVRIAPAVFAAGVQKQRTRRNEREEKMRVHRQIIPMPGVFLKVARHPIRKIDRKKVVKEKTV